MCVFAIPVLFVFAILCVFVFAIHYVFVFATLVCFYSQFPLQLSGAEKAPSMVWVPAACWQNASNSSSCSLSTNYFHSNFKEMADGEEEWSRKCLMKEEEEEEKEEEEK